jgi:hypothetical protein
VILGVEYSGDTKHIRCFDVFPRSLRKERRVEIVKLFGAIGQFVLQKCKFLRSFIFSRRGRRRLLAALFQKILLFDDFPLFPFAWDAPVY